MQEKNIDNMPAQFENRHVFKIEMFKIELFYCIYETHLIYILDVEF